MSPSPSPTAEAPTPTPVVASTPTPVVAPAPAGPAGPPPRVTTTSLPGAVGGVDYSAQLTASGGVPPYTWSWVAQPPQGFPCCVNLGMGGVLSGFFQWFTWMSPGPYVAPVKVRVSDSAGQSARADLSITITGVHFTVRSFPSGTVGAPYNVPFQIAAGVPPYQVVPGMNVNPMTLGLPPGLHFVQNPNSVNPTRCGNLSPGDTCLLTGTPTTAGTFTTTIGADDSSGRTTDWLTITITIG